MSRTRKEEVKGRRRYKRKQRSEKEYPGNVVPEGKTAREVTIIEVYNDLKNNLKKSLKRSQNQRRTNDSVVQETRNEMAVLRQPEETHTNAEAQKSAPDVVGTNGRPVGNWTPSNSLRREGEARPNNQHAWSPPNIQNKSTPSGPMSMPSNQQMSSNMVSRSYSWNDPYGNHGIYLGQYDRTQPPSYYHPGQNYWGYNSSYPNQNWGYDMHQSTNHTSMDKPEVTNTGSISNQNWSSNNTPQTYPSIDQSQEICGLPRASSQSWPPGSSQSTNRNGYEYSDQPTYTSLDKPQFSSNGHATHGYFTASHS